MRFSTAALRSGGYPKSLFYPAHLRNIGKVERRTTTLTQGDARLPHNLNRPHAISCPEHEARPPSELARCVAVGQQSLKLGAVGRANIKADVGASHPPFMPRLSSFGNPMSGMALGSGCIDFLRAA